MGVKINISSFVALKDYPEDGARRKSNRHFVKTYRLHLLCRKAGHARNQHEAGSKQNNPALISFTNSRISGIIMTDNSEEYFYIVRRSLLKVNRKSRLYAKRRRINQARN
jgi:hypothetical protein